MSAVSAARSVDFVMAARASKPGSPHLHAALYPAEGSHLQGQNLMAHCSGPLLPNPSPTSLCIIPERISGSSSLGQLRGHHRYPLGLCWPLHEAGKPSEPSNRLPCALWPRGVTIKSKRVYPKGTLKMHLLRLPRCAF